MSLRKAITKSEKKPKRRASVQEEKPKRKRVKKKKKRGFDPDRVALTDAEVRAAKKDKEILMSMTTALEQLKARCEASINVINDCEKPIHFLRAMQGVVYSSPSTIFCKDRKQNIDIALCGVLCKAHCSEFVNRRYICKLLRCDIDTRNGCVVSGNYCKIFSALQQFPHQYLMAYTRLHELRRSFSDEELSFSRNKKNIRVKKIKKKKRKAAK